MTTREITPNHVTHHSAKTYKTLVPPKGKFVISRTKKGMPADRNVSSCARVAHVTVIAVALARLEGNALPLRCPQTPAPQDMDARLVTLQYL